MQLNKHIGMYSSDYLKFLVGDDGKFPQKYVTTKTIHDTLTDLYNDWCFIEMGWNVPVLKDLRHEEGSTESEAVYYSVNPPISGWNRKGKLVNSDEIELEAFYESIVITEPRSLHRN